MIGDEMSKKTVPAGDYARLKKAFEIITSKVLPDIGLPLDRQPITLLTNLEKTSPAGARSALSMGLNDLVRMSFDLPRDSVVNIDQILTAQNLPTLSLLRVQFSDKVQKLMKKGRVSNPVEYYLLKDVLDSGTSDELNLQTLQEILETYENSIENPDIGVG